ncbi:low choriolytic enzyme-like [Aulostomus maculatus]
MDQADIEDVSTAIMRINNASSELLLEGDILIPTKRTAMKCLKGYRCLWPKSRNGNVEVPFVIDERYDQLETSAILKAMEDFEPKTCIRFIPRVSQTAYLTIEPRFGCFSLMGSVGDKQLLSLQRYACTSHGIIQHELLHALGFYHEHTRSDRDKYVRINWENIHQYYLYNFEKRDTNNLRTPYDYNSVMHYGRTAFGKPGTETITPFPDPTLEIGQREGLSPIDILRINRLYKCRNNL